MPDATPEKSTENSLQSNAEAQQHASHEPVSRTRRLGILSLGWHAHEKTMPAKLLSRLQAGDATIVAKIIPLLAGLSAQDSSVRSTYLCHPSVQYITKLPNEGSFCGYRNIQMLVSFILGSGSKSTTQSKAFPSGMPSIPQLQDIIEIAWDHGYNSQGRIETGGIRGTRKHIGTPEAQALFQSLGIPCRVRRFESSSALSAFNALLEYVEAHFANENSATAARGGSGIHKTNVSPIYLQRPRHSLTVVGIEICPNSQRNLLVLDPGYRPSPRMMLAAQAVEMDVAVEKRISLTPYRKGRWQLGGYKEFETLTLG